MTETTSAMERSQDEQDRQVKEERKLQEDEFQSYQVNSDILLSKIEYEEIAESPQMNYKNAEAKIKELTETAQYVPKKSRPYCGCGNYYSCTSSLYLHIRSKHQGIPPPNTIGGPKGIVKKPPPNDPVVKVEDEGNQGSYAKFPLNNVQAKPTSEVQQNKSPSNNNTVDRKKIDEQNKKNCKFCNKNYSCNSALNLHLKRKHPARQTADGKTEYGNRVEESQQKTFQCTKCNLKYASKSALGLHFNNKHINSNNNDQQMPYGQNKVQKCGCGLVYQSRSALNMHVKKKHAGVYQAGTTEKPGIRAPSYREQKNAINRIDNYLTGQAPSQQQSIYDSDSEQPNPSVNDQGNNSRQEPGKSSIRCGCGRTYSCSSSLNLHIKKNHNRIPPLGTIGGPRGLRPEEDHRHSSQIESSDKSLTCSDCRRCIEGSFFLCKKCDKHQKCSKCFWAASDNSNLQHDWDVCSLTEA